MVHKIQPYFPSVFPFSYFIPTAVPLLLCFQVRAFELAIHSTWNLSFHVKPGLCFTPPSNVTFLLRLTLAILFKIAPLLHPVNSIFFFRTFNIINFFPFHLITTWAPKWGSFVFHTSIYPQHLEQYFVQDEPSIFVDWINEKLFIYSSFHPFIQITLLTNDC